MKKVDTILFDFDGTLFDTDELVTQSFRYSLQHYGLTKISDERIRSTFGAVMEDIMQGFISEFHLNATVEELVSCYRDYHEKIFAQYIHPFEGITELLEKVSALGLKSGVLTSRKKRSAMRGIELFDYNKYFSAIQTEDDTVYAKPDPRAAYDILERMGSNAESSIIVGDTAYDILCGKNAGAITALALWGREMSNEQILDLAPDIVSHSPEEFYTSLLKFI